MAVELYAKNKLLLYAAGFDIINIEFTLNKIYIKGATSV